MAKFVDDMFGAQRSGVRTNISEVVGLFFALSGLDLDPTKTGYFRTAMNVLGARLALNFEKLLMSICPMRENCSFGFKTLTGSWQVER